MDVTAREDLLQRELTQVRATLEQRSKELEVSEKSRQDLQNESNAQITEMKAVVKDLLGKKIALENANEEQNASLANVNQKLEESYAWNKTLQDELADLGYSTDELKRQNDSAQRELTQVNAEKDAAQKELAQVKKQADERATRNLKIVSQSQKDLKEAQAKVGRLSKHATALQEQKEALERLSKNQREMIDAAKKTSQTTSGRAAESERELSKIQAELQKRTNEATQAVRKVSTLAVYAEELKAEKVSLQRTLQAEKQAHADLMAMNQATYEHQINALKGGIAEKVQDLEETLRTTQSELGTARAKSDALEARVSGLNKQLGQMETERQEKSKKLKQLYSNHKASVMKKMLEEETFTEVMLKGLYSLKAAFDHAHGF